MKLKRFALMATAALALLGAGGHSAHAESSQLQAVPGTCGSSTPPTINGFIYVAADTHGQLCDGNGGGGGTSGAPYTYTALGCGQLTSLSASTLLSSVSGGIPAGATLASLSVEAQTVRYRDDGTAPTASVGTPLPAGTSAWPYTGPLAALRLIQVAASATVDVCFYK